MNATPGVVASEVPSQSDIYSAVSHMGIDT